MYDEQKERVIKYLKEEGYIKSSAVERALLKVPRELFVPYDIKDYAYIDAPLSIGCGQTISAIHMVALMSSILDVKKGMNILEIGTGSGYQAAVLSELAGPKGKVISLESVPELAELARKNLEKAGYSKVTVICADGSIGYEKDAPYDRIIVTASAPKVPEPLKSQLKDRGRMAIPVGDSFTQDLLMITRNGNRFDERNYGAVRFVPLLGEYGWKS